MKQPYTLSDAIRIGAALRPQAFGALFREGKSCARGAAIEATTGEFCDNRLDGLYQFALQLQLHVGYPVLDERAACPACADGQEYMVDTIITHLNDYHKWTREAIADVVEQAEERMGYVTLTEQVESMGVGVTEYLTV